MTAAILPELVAIAAGSFLMGNDAGRQDEQPAHRVQLRPFQAAIRPVSNEEYAAFVEATGHDGAPFSHDAKFADPKQPVVGVSWLDALDYCAWLAAETGRRFRLPTEAEREYAALGGLEGGDWPWGNDAPDSVEALQEIVRLEQPHVPGPECANGYGLRCMVDNVHEWCSDWYDGAYYAVSPSRAPRGPASGTRRASRGGSWRHLVKFNRISARSSLAPTFRYNDYGFRLFAD